MVYLTHYADKYNMWGYEYPELLSGRGSGKTSWMSYVTLRKRDPQFHDYL